MRFRSVLGVFLVSTGFVPLGCDGSVAADEESCADAELPEEFSCAKTVPVEQSECGGNAYDADPPSVRSTEDGFLIERAHFRCKQEVCAYVDTSGERTQVLVQPCDMLPDAPARCDCLSSIAIDVSIPPEGIDVLTRFDSVGGEKEPTLVGTVYDASAEPVVLCDGSDELRFTLTSAGGNYTGLPRVIQEVGFAFLLIDGKCNYVAMQDAAREIRQGTLSAAEAQTLSDELMLGHWDERFGGTSPPNCADGGTTSLRSPTESFSLYCASNELTLAGQSALETLYDAGTPLDEEVRYTIAEVEDAPWETLALPWPLDVDPATLAVPAQTDDSATVAPLVATEEEADALRALRAQWLAQEAATGPWYRIPVAFETADGVRYYDVALRDVTSFETDGELDIDGHFAPDE